MIETGGARREELDEMLGLMCRAFSLPFSAARELFYKDPYFDIGRKRVLRLDGALVSCLTIVDCTLWIGNATVRVGGIAGVATEEAHRRHGYGGRLLTDTLGALREQGYGLTALFPYSYPYYERLGWERAGVQYHATVPRAALSAYAEGRLVRHASPSDRRHFEQLYARHSRGRTGRWVRDAKRWDYLFAHAADKVAYRHGQTECYALYEVREQPNGATHARVLEIVAPTDEAQRAICGFFAQLEEIEAVEYTASLEDLRDSGLLGPVAAAYAEPSARIEAVPGAMFRVVDLAACLTHLLPNFEGMRGRITLHLHDEHRPREAPASVALVGDGADASVEPAGLADRRGDWVEGDVRAWSSVLVGYNSAADALSLNRLRASSPNAGSVAAGLFPRRTPFVPVPDYF